MAEAPHPFEIAIAQPVLDELSERLARTRWPTQPGDLGWEMGADFGYLRSLCDYWADQLRLAPDRAALNGLSNWRWEGIHFIWERADRGERGVAAPERLPVVLIHGWPGWADRVPRADPALVAAGHDVVVPSLPGFAFSEPSPSDR